MPSTRRSTGNHQARSGGQSTLSFSNKITKNVPSHTKKNIVNEPKLAQVKPSAPAASTHDDVKEATSTPAQAPAVAPEPVAEDLEAVSDEAGSASSDDESEVDTVPEKSDAELKAEKISDTQISKYWKDLEKQRKAPRVHQQGLTLSEKVLRYFDVSSQYGPCVGITRLRRWQRADKLGLQPPPEVLAILMKEEKKNTQGIQTAHIDEILNSTAIGS